MINAGDKITLSKVRGAITWEVLGVRKSIKKIDGAREDLLIVRHGKTIRRNVSLQKITSLKRVS